jgi:hypothetical protein
VDWLLQLQQLFRIGRMYRTISGGQSSITEPNEVVKHEGHTPNLVTPEGKSKHETTRNIGQQPLTTER